ncbi:MAG: DUF342 domain-containing protein [Fibrobacteres bacterium]|nr:DUF342 domain-containing protein [Fibrobacterota bacterium]
MLVEVLICNDGMEAKLSIRDFNPVAWRKEFPANQSLKSLLLAKGLAPDLIEDAAVDSICALLSETSAEGQLALSLEEAHSIVLAAGSPPEHEEAEGLMFHKSYLSDPHDIEALDQRLQEVAGGNGKQVLGPEFDPGALVLHQDTLLVVGKEGMQPGLIRVSDDKLEVWLVLQKASACLDHDARLGLESVKTLMTRMGLLSMQDEARVLKSLEAFLKDGAEQEVLLLKGILPRPGKNGSIQLLVDPEPDLPDPEMVQNVDFKEFTFFRAVAKGDRLARILPPEPGSAGIDVFGKITLPRPGVPVQVKPGRNTGFAPDSPDVIIASKDGKLAVEDGIPYVVDTLKVAGDVSFKTGNLRFPGSIEVEGSVLDKFAIEAKGDVGIGGVVENGVVISEGSILIKGGVIGGGSGLIKSKLSSVTIGFIHNQRIESYSNIVIYNEVLNGQLLAKKSILMKSKSHSVIGGHLVAYSSIEIHNAGNEAGAKTILEVGKDFEAEAELLRKRETLKAVRADFEFLEKRRNKLEMIVRWEAGKNPENRLLEQRVKGVLKFLDRLRLGLNARLNELEAALYNPGDCHIAVSGTANPGTVLKYRDKVIPITEAMRGKRWLFKPD